MQKLRTRLKITIEFTDRNFAQSRLSGQNSLPNDRSLDFSRWTRVRNQTLLPPSIWSKESRPLEVFLSETSLKNYLVSKGLLTCVILVGVRPVLYVLFNYYSTCKWLHYGISYVFIAMGPGVVSHDVGVVLLYCHYSRQDILHLIMDALLLFVPYFKRYPTLTPTLSAAV